MKFKILAFTLLACFLGNLNLQAQNPYKSLGVEMETLTLSKGKFIEFFPNDSLVQIGSVIFDTRNNLIVSFVVRDTSYLEANLEPEVSSRFLQTDPYAAKFPNVSPYNYALNNPLKLIDPDGRCPKPADTDNTVCVSLFIQAEKAIGLKGDDRNFSSDSDPEKSRFFVQIDVDNKEFSATVNPTCDTSGDCVEPLVDKNEINVEFDDEGGFTLTFSAKNSKIRLSPSIDGEISFAPDEEGGFLTKGNRDAFPSAEGYYWKDGQVSTLFQKEEGFSPFLLMSIFRNQKWEDKKNDN